MNITIRKIGNSEGIIIPKEVPIAWVSRRVIPLN